MGSIKLDKNHKTDYLSICQSFHLCQHSHHYTGHICCKVTKIRTCSNNADVMTEGSMTLIIMPKIILEHPDFGHFCYY